MADALKHPNWDMGAKITVDSATMMNKGLEVIEAHYLFGADYEDIDIVVHPESIIHSMVRLVLSYGPPLPGRLPCIRSVTEQRRTSIGATSPTGTFLSLSPVFTQISLSLPLRRCVLLVDVVCSCDSSGSLNPTSVFSVVVVNARLLKYCTKPLQVEAQDTSVIAQLGWPDMRLPLLYSLSWPHRVRMSYDQLDLAKLCTFFLSHIVPRCSSVPSSSKNVRLFSHYISVS